MPEDQKSYFEEICKLMFAKELKKELTMMFKVTPLISV